MIWYYITTFRGDVEQLWAEAIVACKAGEKAWLDGDEAELAALEQDARYEKPEIMAEIEDYIAYEHLGKERPEPLDRIFEEDFFKRAYDLDKLDMTNANSRRLRQEFKTCMGSMGWVNDILGGGKKRWGAWLSPDYPRMGKPGPDEGPKTRPGASGGSQKLGGRSQSGQSGDAAPAKGAGPAF